MNKLNIKKLCVAVMAAVSMLGTAVIPTLAEGNHQGNTTAVVPVNVSGTTSSNVVIEQEINGLYQVIDVKPVYQSSTISFAEDDVGKYTYRMYQVTEGESNITWDKTVYQIDVYVLIDEITQRYSTETVIYKIGSGQKSASVSFVNQIKPVPTATPTASPTATPGTTPTPGGTSDPADSDKTADVSSRAEWITFSFTLCLAGVLVWAYQKDKKQRAK